MKKYKIIIMLLLLFLMIGCNGIDIIENNSLVVPEEIMELNQYFVPESVPKVFTSKEGYENLSPKLVLFKGEDELADNFQVVEAETKQVVFNGTIESGNDAVSFGYFDELEREGTYYIQTDIIGQSYPFTIGKQTYKRFLNTIAESYGKEKIDINNIVSFCEGIVIALVAYEFYPEVLGEEGLFYILPTIREKVEQLIAIEDMETLTLQEQLMISATLAKFYKMYQGYDEKFAKMCLNQSENNWREIQHQFESEKESTYFLMTELYKATGNQQYNSKINELYSMDSMKTEEEIKLKLLGDITYLSTRRKVDLSKCNILIDERLNRVQIIADEKNRFPDKSIHENLKKTMNEILEIVVIDHLFESQAYESILINKLYYLVGCNLEGYNYLGEEMDSLQIGDQATLILLLSSILGRDALLEE